MIDSRVDCEKMWSLLGACFILRPQKLGVPKGTIILTTYHNICSFGELPSQELLSILRPTL